MSMSRRFKWFACWTMGALLLGACAMPGDEEVSAQDGADEMVVAQGQDPATGDVSVQLSADKAALHQDESVEVAVTFTNNARHAVRLLAWYAPAGELEEDLFVLERDGQPVEFIGPHYKRPTPEEADYVTVPPGKSVTRKVDLTNFYDLSQTGNYSVRYAIELMQPGARKTVSLESNDMKLWIEGRAAALPQAPQGDTQSITSSVAFNKCTVDQQATILQGLDAASTMANGATSYLSGSPSATPRYTTWFGAYSSSGWNTAESHFVAIKDAIDTKPLTFDCGCKKKYYAYVYPNQPYNIYLCSVFWSAPLSGTDSKGGTIIHEMSHFDVVAGTDDWAYGQTNAKSLAISDPAKALSNADSHEYFAENTPALQ